MTKVYGASDDLVIIESSHATEEIDCYRKDVRICFVDGTVICIGYPKSDLGVWWITVEETGTAEYNLIVCNDKDAAIYSDIFEINAEIESYTVSEK